MLGNDVPFIGVMNNIDLLEHDIFLIIYAPLPIRGLDSSPVNVMAIEGIPGFRERRRARTVRLFELDCGLMIGSSLKPDFGMFGLTIADVLVILLYFAEIEEARNHAAHIAGQGNRQPPHLQGSTSVFAICWFH